MKRTIFIIVIVLISGFIFAQQTNSDVEKVKKVIVDAYVKGVQIDRDVEAMKKGIHEDFTLMFVSRNQLGKITLENWISRTEQRKANEAGKPKRNITHKFEHVDVTKHAAVAKLELYLDSKHIFTDYFSLYKFTEGWKIVNKITCRH